MIELKPHEALALAAWLVSRFNTETTAGAAFAALLDSGRVVKPNP